MRGCDNNWFGNSLEDGMKPWTRRETDKIDWAAPQWGLPPSYPSSSQTISVWSFLLNPYRQIPKSRDLLFILEPPWVIILLAPIPYLSLYSSFLSDFVVLSPAPQAEWQNIISCSLNLALAMWPVLVSDIWVKGQFASSDPELVFSDPELVFSDPEPVVWFLYHHYKRNIPTLGRRSTDHERHMECGCPNQPTDLQWELPRCLKQSAADPRLDQPDPRRSKDVSNYKSLIL